MQFIDLIVDTISDNAPAIVTGIGIGAVLIGCVEACKATMGLGEDIEDHKDAMEEIAEKAKEAEDEGKEYNKGKAKTKVFVGTAKAIAKRYALPATAIAVGVACLIGGNVMLNTRNIALASAANTISTAFEEYRGRVIDELGEEADARFRTGTSKVEITEIDEKGKTKTTEIDVADPKAKGRGYGRYFTPSNPYWYDDPDQRDFFFNQEQQRANRLFHINGKYTLDKLWERLGFVDSDSNPDSMVMGWLEGSGDQFINLNVSGPITIPDGNGGFVEAYFIDPNVQTNVYTTIKKRMRLLNNKGVKA